MTAVALPEPPPRVELAEVQIVGACLAYGATGRAQEALRSSDVFYHRPLALIYEACVAVAGRGEPVDEVSVEVELRRSGKLAEVEMAGGPDYLHLLASGVASGANVAHHAAMVLEAACLRSLIETGTELADRARRGDRTPAELAAGVQEALDGITDGRPTGAARKVDAVMSETLEDLEYRQQHPGLSGISTGLIDLDELTAGWQRGDLVVIAARPSMGKSGLAFSAALAAARADVPTLVYSLEMPARQVGQRLVSVTAGIDLHRLRTAHMDDATWDAAGAAAREVAGAPLWVDDSAGITVADIQGRTRRLAKRERLGFVVVDYLQLVEGIAVNDSHEREVARISKGLKALAKELDIPVLALSQLSRASEGRADHRPILSDLRYSGAIEQDADVVVFIYRPEVYREESDPGVAELIVGKQRNGPVGTVKVQFDARTASFRNLARQEAFPSPRRYDDP